MSEPFTYDTRGDDGYYPEPVLVHDWLTPALRSWFRFMFPRRRGWFVVFGWLFFAWLIVLGVKFAIYWSIGLVMCVAFLISAAWDLGSYPIRKRRWLG